MSEIGEWTVTQKSRIFCFILRGVHKSKAMVLCKDVPHGEKRLELMVEIYHGQDNLHDRVNRAYTEFTRVEVDVRNVIGSFQEIQENNLKE
ncbi:hypothetical protein A3Q56_08081 [Intoshia linei]|uniref:Uncharacterized protein n=1 Tax=Intoshia linei TaxID=1819745 RepID=A0A177AQF0_9BILA|nr:hypothetical protein A3Q56_08081 [Intoshia linei]